MIGATQLISLMKYTNIGQDQEQVQCSKIRAFVCQLRGFDLFRDATNDDDQTTTTNGG